MSGKIRKILKLSTVASVDVVSAGTLNFFIDSLYKVDPTDFTLAQLFFRVLSRVVTTAWLGDEMRDFLYPFDFEDPTGGFFFAAALLWQPQLYKDVHLLVTRTIDQLLKMPIFSNLSTLAGNSMANERDPTQELPVDAKIGSQNNQNLELIHQQNVY